VKEKSKSQKGKPVRVSRDMALMLTSGIFSLRSTCHLGNGAVLAKEGRIIACGFNGAPSGQSHCSELGCILDEKGHCQRSIHAEVNSVAMAARYGISTEGSTLYCTTAPCPSCSKLLINSGITRVVYGKTYSDMSGVELLKACGVEVTHFDSKELISGN